MKNKILTSFCILLFVPLIARGHSPLPKTKGRYGPEFTFTKNGERPNEYEVTKLLDRIYDHLVDGQPDEAKFSVAENGKRFHSPNGWWFRVTRDGSTFEVQMSPLSVDDFRRFKDDIQDAIFVSMANEGFFPWDYLGGGHLNVDVSAFEASPLLLYNFLIDFWNHNELAMGALGYNLYNAYPFTMLTEKSQNLVTTQLQTLLANAYGENDVGTERFCRDLHSILTKCPRPMRDNLDVGKNSDLHFGTPGRIEIRPVRPQASADTWLNQIELIDRRIEYLRQFDYPLPLKPLIPLVSPLIEGSNNPDSHVYHPPIPAQQALRMFYTYVTQTGLLWKNHRDYVYPDWTRPQEEGKPTELEIFETSQFFQIRERLLTLRSRSSPKDNCRLLLSEN